MEGRLNHYRHHLGDYAKDTAHLTMLEDGAYGRLMRRYYATEAPLPADMAELCRVSGARTSAEKQAVKNVLRDFFDLQADGYHQKRIDEEIAEYKARAEKNREFGRTGGRPKKNPNGFQQETQTVSETKPKANPQETLASSHKPVAISQETQNPEAKRSGGNATTAAVAETAALGPPVGTPPEIREFPRGDDPRVMALHGLAVASRCRASILDAQQWVCDGLTELQLRAAIDRARAKKPPGDSVPIAFLQCMVRDVLAGVVSSEPRGKDAIAAAIASIAAKEAHATH